MTRPHPIKRIRATEAFGVLLRKLPPDIQAAARQAVKDLVADPHPKKYRLKKQTRVCWTIHITNNHSHKLSFSMDGDCAVLRKVGTHKEIDRSP